MKSIYAKFIINILVIISLLSCQYQEKMIEPATDMNNTTNYYDVLEVQYRSLALLLELSVEHLQEQWQDVKF